MTKAELRQAILDTLTQQGIDICKAGSKGDGFFIRDMGFVKFEAARKMAGLPKHEAKPRQERQAAWGDYAVIAMLNGIK